MSRQCLDNQFYQWMLQDCSKLEIAICDLQLYQEVANLRYQFGTSSYGGRRYLPLVFTEQGVLMLSAVLKSERAIEVSLQIVRVFIRMRKILATHKELRDKIESMDRENKKNFKIIFKVIAKLMATGPKDNELKIIGFKEKK